MAGIMPIFPLDQLNHSGKNLLGRWPETFYKYSENTSTAYEIQSDTKSSNSNHSHLSKHTPLICEILPLNCEIPALSSGVFWFSTLEIRELEYIWQVRWKCSITKDNPAACPISGRFCTSLFSGNQCQNWMLYLWLKYFIQVLVN